MTSQRSFASRLGKFNDGNTVLKGITAYTHGNILIQLSSLEQKGAAIVVFNQSATDTEKILKGLQKERKYLAFKIKDENPECIQCSMKAIEYNLKSEIGEKSPEYLKVYAINKKIQPPSEKKQPPKEGESPKKDISKSEKSYQSLVGFGNDVHTIITGLGAKYNPSNPNITVVNFRGQLDKLVDLNSKITTAGDNYTAAVKNRDEAYNGMEGISALIGSVKDYLAGLPGGRKNPGYVAYAAAVK